MKMKGIFKKSVTVILITVMTVAAVTGCGKGKKKNDDSLLNEAVNGSKDYVYKVEDIDIGDNKINGYPTGIDVIGDKVYIATGNYDENKTQIITFNTDGSNVEFIDIPTNKGEYYSSFAFLPDGSFYACLSISSYDEEEGQPQTLEGGEASSAASVDEAAEESSKDASKDDAAAKDASKEDEKADSKKAPSDAASEASSKDKDDAAKDASKEDAAANDASKEDASDEASSAGSSEDGSEVHEEGMGFYEGGEEQMFLVKFDNKGNVLDKVDITSKGGDDGYFNVRSLLVLDDGKLLVSTTKGIETYSDGGDFKSLVSIENSDNPYMDSYALYKGANGQIFAQSYGETGVNIQKFNPENGELSDPIEGFTKDYGYASNLFGGNGYDIYLATENAFCGYDASKNEIVKLMDYIDSDIETDYTIPAAYAISDKEFISVIPGFEDDYKLVRLTKIPADQVKDKKVITIGGVYIDYKFREKAVKFNQASDEYKIKLVDYSKFNSDENWNAGYQQFDMDIVSGNVPDIIALSADQPIEKYRNKGVFMDLKPLFDKDEDLKGIEILPNILKAMTTGDKMYTVIPEFMVGTMITRARFAEGKNSLTYQDCEDIMKQNNVTYQTAYGLTDKKTALGMGIIFAGDKYMDTPNKKCSFDSEGFIKLLEFANNFPNEMDYDKYDEYEGYYKTNQALFAFADFSRFGDYKRYKQGIFGDDIALVGLPNDEGVNEAAIYPTGMYAISAQTKYPEIAWDFVKSFFTDEYQNNIEYGFPVTKSAFEEAKKKSLDRPYKMVDGKKEYEDEIYYIDGKEVTLSPLTQEEADIVADYVLSIEKFYDYNTDVHNIITEEAEAYFSGQKSAEEVAKIIQSRINIYINENS